MLFLTSSISRNAGGLFESVRRLAQELDRQKVMLDVLSLRDEFTDVDLARWAPLAPVLCPRRRPFGFSYAPALSSEIAALDPDLVHAHGIWMYPSVASLLWARKTNRPYLISPRGMLDPWALKNSRWKKRLAGTLYERSHLQGAACIHALCEAELKSIRDYGIRCPVCVIPNGVDLPGEPGLETQYRHQALPGGQKVLLYLGRIHPKKGLRELIRAWQEYRRQGLSGMRDWCLVIAGWDQGGHEATLKALLKDDRSGRDIVFLGPMFGKDKDALLRSVDACVLPSFSEGLPMAVLEAWAYRLPVLMTEECNLPVGFQANAAIRLGHDRTGLRAGLAGLFSASEAERRAMGEKGFELVQEDFTWSKVASEMKRVYDWALDRGDRPSCVMVD